MEDEAGRPTDEAAEAPRGPVAGLFRSAARLLATAIGVVHTRLELLSTELQEEVHRVAEIMVWTLVSLLAAGVGLFLLALVVIFVFWDTHRIAASIAVTSAFFVLAVGAALVLRSKVRAKPRPLNATLAELRRDRDSLLSRRPS